MTDEKHIPRTLTPFVRDQRSVQSQDIGWGSYGGYEGPMYRGKVRFVPDLTNDTPMLFKALAAAAEAEGGHYDAVNMYDKGICSVGLIQVIESGGVMGVTDLLGEVMMSCREAHRELYPVFTLTGYSMSRIDVLGAKGAAVRFVSPSGSLVDSDAAARTMFFGAANVGRKGSWSPSNKALAKEWAARIASVFQHQDAADVQRTFMARRLRSYIMPSAEILFGPDHSEGSIDNWELFRVLYLSFAVNTPSRTAECYAYALTRKRGFLDQFEAFVRRLLLINPPFYPDRLLTTIKLLRTVPNFRLTLRVAEAVAEEHKASGITVVRTQKALVALGYDIGPSGADGVMGAKTKRALATFAATTTSLPIVQDADGLGDWALDHSIYTKLYADSGK